MKSITRSLPLLLALPAMHLHAQSISPAWDAYMKKQTSAAPAAAGPVAATEPSVSQASPPPRVSASAPGVPAASAPRRASRNEGGFFVGVQGGKGWIYEDADQTAKAVSAGYRWDAGGFTLVGIEAAAGQLDASSDRDFLYPEVRFASIGGTTRVNFGSSRWFGIARGGYFSARADGEDGDDETIDGAYLGVGIGVDVSRHFNISLGYTAYLYGTTYYYARSGYNGGGGYVVYETDISRADMLLLGAELRF